MRNTTVILIVLFALQGCATVEKTAQPSQNLNVIAMAGIGDTVLRLDRERDLVNAFGRADLFGRKTKEGFTEIKFAGVEPDGTVVLLRKDVEILSNETTMTRTPFSMTSGGVNTATSGSSNLVGNRIQSNSNSSSSFNATTISSGQAFNILIPPDTIAVRLAPNEKRLPIAGHIIEVINASKNSIEYRLTKQ
jgi:hypothetical protein